MSYNSKYTGAQVEQLLDQVASGGTGGGGGVAVETDPIFSASPAAKITDENISSWNNKVDKVNGKQLSTEDFTTLLKQKLDGLSNYDDTEISQAVSNLRTDLDTLVSGDTTTAIKTFNEVIAFLDGISDTEDLSSIIASIEQQIAAKGTYTKPSNGIPKTDLASDVQTSLGKADTALQSYTEQYKGTVTGVKMNGTTKNPSSGVVDLGTVITAHQDLSGYQTKLVSGTNIKTINGQSILGSGDIVVEGDSSNGVAYPVIMDYSGAVQTVEPNTYYKFLAVTHIMFYFGTSVPDVVNEYVFEIKTSIGFAHASFPDTIQWANGEPNFEGGKTYQISIVNNIGLIVSV